jgi:hypothetical protein
MESPAPRALRQTQTQNTGIHTESPAPRAHRLIIGVPLIFVHLKRHSYERLKTRRCNAVPLTVVRLKHPKRKRFKTCQRISVLPTHMHPKRQLYKRFKTLKRSKTLKRHKTSKRFETRHIQRLPTPTQRSPFLSMNRFLQTQIYRLIQRLRTAIVER